MLNWIIEVSLRNRLLVCLLVLVLVVLGVRGLIELPIDAFPDTTPIQVQVNTVSPSLNPEEIEQQITFPIELAISGLPGLQNVRSVSKFGFSQVVATFEDRTGIYLARQLISEQLQSVELPEGVGRPKLGPISTGLGEVFHYLVRSDDPGRSLMELRELHDWVIKPELRKVPGVAEVNSWGGYEKQFHVVVQPKRLIEFELTLNDLFDALKANNQNVGGGQIVRSGESLLVHGIGLGSASHASGYVGFDGLVVIHTDGTVEVRQGAGNLGTESYAAVARLAAETLQVPWEQVQVSWGRSDKSAFTLGQFSSNTTFTTGLSNVKAAETAVQYLKEIAATELGGTADDYEVAGGEVANGDGDSMTFAEAAQAAIALGGKYSGEEVPQQYQESLVPLTLGAARDVTGEALVAFGKSGSDDLDGFVDSFNAAIAHVIIDLETGKVEVEEMANWGDSGTIVHPDSYTAQIEGGAIQGIGYALTEHMRFDEETGIPVNTDWYKNKPPSIMDYSNSPLKVGGVDEPDPYGPHGAKGVGEPPVGAAAAAVVSAVENGLGTTFMHHPITASDVLDKIEAGETEVS
jgi:hypothetical protein